MNQKQWEPLTTPEAVIEAIKAGRHVEFTACGCDYDLPICTEFGSGGWIVEYCKDEDEMLDFLEGEFIRNGRFRYRALISPAQPASGDAYAQSLAERHLPSDAAERIAARVPLPEPVAMGGHATRGSGDFYLHDRRHPHTVDVFTADQLRAAILAGVREAMMGGVAVASVVESDVGNALDFPGGYCETLDGLQVGTKLYTAPPAGRVEVSEAMVERLAMHMIRAQHPEMHDVTLEYAWKSTPSIRDHWRGLARAALTAALQEPEA